MSWTILTKDEDSKQFKKRFKELSRLEFSKERRVMPAREIWDKAKPRIRKDAVVLVEKAASYCVIVILYDTRNHKGCMVHVENPTLAEGALQQMISHMYMSGSKDILAVMIGGSKLADKKAANRNWKASEKVLKRNHVTILKELCVRDVQVAYMALWNGPGTVKAIISQPESSETDVYIEFRMSKFQ